MSTFSLSLVAGITVAVLTGAASDPDRIASPQNDTETRSPDREAVPVRSADELSRILRTTPTTGAAIETNSINSGDSRPLSIDQSFVSLGDGEECDNFVDIAFTNDGTKAAVVNRVSNNVQFFDLAAGVWNPPIPVGAEPVSITLTADGRLGLVANFASGDVSVLDVVNEIVVRIIDLGDGNPTAIEVTPDGREAVIGLAFPADGGFAIVDLATFEVVRSFPALRFRRHIHRHWALPVRFDRNEEFRISPDGRMLLQIGLIPGTVDETFRAYDLATGEILASIPIGVGGSWLEVSHDGAWALVAYFQGVIRIDLDTFDVSTVYADADLRTPAVIRLTTDDTMAVVANARSLILLDLVSGEPTVLPTGTVIDAAISYDDRFVIGVGESAYIVDLDTRSLVKEIDDVSWCNVVAASPTEYRAFGAATFRGDAETAALYQIDGANAHVEAIVPPGVGLEADGAYNVALSPDGQTAVVTNAFSGTISIVDVLRGSERATIATGYQPHGVAITPDNRYAVIANRGASTVSIVDLEDEAEVAELPVALGPTKVRIADDGRLAFVNTLDSPEGDDFIHFIELNGSDSSVVASIPVGELGGIASFGGGPPVVYWGDIDLATDGSLLAVAGTIDSEIILIDIEQQQEIARLSGNGVTWPTEVKFNSDATALYIGGGLSELRKAVIDGKQSYLEDHFVDVAADAIQIDNSDTYLYAIGSSVVVVDLRTFERVTSVGVPGDAYDMLLSDHDQELYVGAVNNGSEPNSFSRIATRGTETFLIDHVALTFPPWNADYSPLTRTAILTIPHMHGVELFRLRSAADIQDFDVTTGTVRDGSLDDLLLSDDSYLHTRSGFGRTLFDLHNMEMIVSAVTAVDEASTMALNIESFIDEPNGLARISLRNWATGAFDRVGQYGIGTAEEIFTISDIAAADYVDMNGNIELQVKHLVFVPFVAFTFDSFIDWVEIGVE